MNLPVRQEEEGISLETMRTEKLHFEYFGLGRASIFGALKYSKCNNFGLKA